jgi:putative spermidine/putrescine transport system permease protein
VTDRLRGALARSLPAAGLAPYLLFVAVFLLVPVLANVWTALHVDGAWSLESVRRLGEDQYLSSFASSARLSATTALLGGALGLVLAWALATARRPRRLRGLMLSYSGLASQMGGVPLAFAYVALLGTQGLATVAVRETFGWDLSGVVELSSFAGLTVVYLYFQVPLMAILMLPAIQGLRPQWSESAASLGAGRVRYLLTVAGPILAPSLGGAVLLLFANAFAAYATAYALSGGGANLVPIMMGFFITGNVLLDESFGAALASGMLLVVGVCMGLRALLLRRATRWQR